MNRRKKRGGFNPLRQLIILLAALGIASQLAYRQYVRVGHTKHPVVVAAIDLTPGMQIGPKHVQVVQMQEKNIPEGALARVSDVAGRQAVNPRKQGETVLANDITVAGLVQGISAAIPEGRVLLTLPLDNAAIPYRDLRRGDRLDILVAGISTERAPTAYVVAQDVMVLGYTLPPVPEKPRSTVLGVDLDIPDEFTGKPRPSVSLLLAVKPADVIPVTQVAGAGSVRLSFVVHSAENVRKSNLPDVRWFPSPFTSIEIIRGAKLEEVRFP